MMFFEKVWERALSGPFPHHNLLSRRTLSFTAIQLLIHKGQGFFCRDPGGWAVIREIFIPVIGGDIERDLLLFGWDEFDDQQIGDGLVVTGPHLIDFPGYILETVVFPNIAFGIFIVRCQVFLIQTFVLFSSLTFWEGRDKKVI